MKYLMIISIAVCLIGTTGCAVDGYVETQPADVVYTRPGAPGPDYVWIDGDWVWYGGRYQWHEGRWSRPRSGRVWQGGRWDRGTRGYHWQRGHWR